MGVMVSTGDELQLLWDGDGLPEIISAPPRVWLARGAVELLRDTSSLGLTWTGNLLRITGRDRVVVYRVREVDLDGYIGHLAEWPD
jgi:hypothetical protein